jgi:hypothetical protein
MLNSSSADTPISAAFSSASCRMNLQKKAMCGRKWAVGEEKICGLRGELCWPPDAQAARSHDHLVDGL